MKITSASLKKLPKVWSVIVAIFHLSTVVPPSAFPEIVFGCPSSVFTGNFTYR